MDAAVGRYRSSAETKMRGGTPHGVQEARVADRKELAAARYETRAEVFGKQTANQVVGNTFYLPKPRFAGANAYTSGARRTIP